MNAKIRFGIMCAFGAVTTSATLAAPGASAQEATSTVAGYSVSFSGGGWQAANKARAALGKMEEVDKVLLSGTTAFVTTKGGTKLTRSVVRKGFDGSGLKVEGVKEKEIAKPAEAYQLAITGGTWATTNERLRDDLEKLDEVSAAFVNAGSIILLMNKADSFDQDKIGKITQKRKSTIKSANKTNSPI